MNIYHPIFIDSDNYKADSNNLYGYCLSDNDEIYLGDSGWQERDRLYEIPPLDGQYIWISKKNNTIRIRTDITGQEAVYYYCSKQYWAISNSFYLLTLSLRSREIELEFNDSVLDCFLYNKGKHISAQLMSNNTLAKEIRLLPQNFELKISKENGNYNSKESKYYDFMEEAPKNISEYSEMMHEYVLKKINLIKSLSCAGYKLRISLSGGYDSREIFSSAVLAKKIYPEVDFDVFSDTNSPEFKISKYVANTLGFSVKDRNSMFESNLSKNRLTTNESFNNWLIGNSGTYIPVLIPISTINESRGHVDFWGFVSYEWDYFLRDQSSLNGGSPNIKTVEEIKLEIKSTTLPEGKKNNIIKELESYFFDIGVPISMENSMDMYYMGTRSRHHYGRRWFKNIQNPGIQIGPLQLKEQILLNFFCSKQKFDKRQFHKDLLSITTPELADIEFDSEWKNLKTIAPTISARNNFFLKRDVKVHGSTLDQDQHQLSLFEYCRVIFREDVIGPEEHDIGEAFRKISKTALDDEDFKTHLTSELIDECLEETTALAIVLPLETTRTAALITNIYSAYLAITKKPRPKSKIPTPLTVRATKLEHSIEASIETEIEGKDIEYAFYLLKNGERIKTAWYSASNRHVFELEETAAEDRFEVIGFIRNKDDCNVIYKKLKV